MGAGKTEYHSIRFKAPEGFHLKRRSNRDKLAPTAEAAESTLSQLMVNDTMNKFKLSRLEVAGIMGRTVATINRYLLPPTHRNFEEMPANFPTLLESWCKQNRKSPNEQHVS